MMAVTIDRKIIDSKYKDPEERRRDIWLWLWLDGRRGQLDDERQIGECLSPCMKSELKDVLEQNPRLNSRAATAQGASLLPVEVLEWISANKRQLAWIATYLRRNYQCQFEKSPAQLQGRDLIIAAIDIWDISLETKLKEVHRIERDWKKHCEADDIFEWFNDKDAVIRCEVAWEWLKEKERGFYRSQSETPNLENLLMFYDESGYSDSKKKLDVIAIKQRYTQRRYREKHDGKKQCNLLLSVQGIRTLDHLAEKYALSKSQLIESLIKMEVEQGLLSSKKING
ncbi:ribbon-helix-helix domain-containing protein [Undibacterium griseum]|uniref:Uncharacterized protein n=1 Tax=Undibacterium griseum TaxID=2762295 RepID=A0ABR6YJN7_9BURK|nr:hypothetical protein [Undibacterium griseum]MBC3884111.1 hypothetical protein [Undibacterium griseum]